MYLFPRELIKLLQKHSFLEYFFHQQWRDSGFLNWQRQKPFSKNSSVFITCAERTSVYLLDKPGAIIAQWLVGRYPSFFHSFRICDVDFYATTREKWFIMVPNPGKILAREYETNTIFSRKPSNRKFTILELLRLYLLPFQFCESQNPMLQAWISHYLTSFQQSKHQRHSPFVLSCLISTEFLKPFQKKVR